MYSAQTANGLGVTDGSGTINPAALNSGTFQSQTQIPVRWNNSHDPTVMRAFSHCDVDLSTAAVISADMEFGKQEL
jgi:hypothetical protein